MNLRDLHYFIAVAEHLHFGRAAQRCHVSQPTLSGQIKKLENELGVSLFERSNRSVMLTETGRKLMEPVRRILLEEKTIESIAETARAPNSGTLTLGAFPTLASYYFPKVALALRAELPSMKIILVEEKTDILITRLLNGELDAAFLALPLREDSLKYQALFNDPFYLAVAAEHPLASQSQVNHKGLRDFELLLLEDGHCLSDQAADFCNTTGVASRQDFRATSLETLRQMVKLGTGITLIPEIALTQNESEIRYIPFAKPVPSRTIALCWRKTSARSQLMIKLNALLTGLRN
ncbi:MAG: DNA-binding transcriptional regulator OxyR [Myxococcales bacterium]|nr:DNA-binding transcriptional regulator OxyR [Myxococcales bacterium]